MVNVGKYTSPTDTMGFNSPVSNSATKQNCKQDSQVLETAYLCYSMPALCGISMTTPCAVFPPIAPGQPPGQWQHLLFFNPLHVCHEQLFYEAIGPGNNWPARFRMSSDGRPLKTSMEAELRPRWKRTNIYENHFLGSSRWVCGGNTDIAIAER